VLTSGNHIWDKRSVFDLLAAEPRLLRPANYPEAPGSGVFIGTTTGGEPVAVLNLQGRTYLPGIDCPFRLADQLLAEIPARIRLRIVDFHAEVTSEKIAFAWHLDGRVTAVIGTHTHVVTADERILPGGTACITDVGMTGPHDSVIGMDKEASLQRFLRGIPARFEPASGDVRLSAVMIDADPASGRATAIQRVQVPEGDPQQSSGSEQ
jgi:metallophosphoesterase (TIGR00282 family)